MKVLRLKKKSLPRGRGSLSCFQTFKLTNFSKNNTQISSLAIFAIADIATDHIQSCDIAIANIASFLSFGNLLIPCCNLLIFRCRFANSLLSKYFLLLFLKAKN